MRLINTNNEEGSSGKQITTPAGGPSTSEASFLQISLVLDDVTVDFPVHKHSPDRQRDLRGITIRPRSSGFVCWTYTSENVQGPIFEEETARGGSFCGGTEYSGDPVTSYMTVMIFYPWVTR